MRYLLPLFLALFGCVAFGQTDLPEIGKLSDIAGKSKVYVIADGEARTAMFKTLENQKGWTLAVKPDDAEIFVEYKMVSRGNVPPTGMMLETGQMYAFFYRDKKKVIAWSDSATGGGFKGDAANKLIKKFLKEAAKK